MLEKVDASAELWVALRKESVDRNAKKSIGYSAVRRRSPQGERG